MQFEQVRVAVGGMGSGSKLPSSPIEVNRPGLNIVPGLPDNVPAGDDFEQDLFVPLLPPGEDERGLDFLDRLGAKPKSPAEKRQVIIDLFKGLGRQALELWRGN